MRVLLLQYDDRDVNQFKSLMEINKEYCKKLKYEYKFLSHDLNIPPYWRKVFLVKEFLHLYDAVLWVDTDAAIVSNESIDHLFKKDTHFTFSSNPSLLHSDTFDVLSAPFCAGVWAVKATPQGKSIMDYWEKSYDPSKWKKGPLGWKADCVYGGYCYEQGSFEVNIFRTENFKPYLTQWEHHVLNYLPRDDHLLSEQNMCPNTFAVHYWSGNRGHIHKHFSSSSN